MKYWMNVPNVVFGLWLNGGAESVTGTLVHIDELGFTIKLTSGVFVGYGSAVLQNAALFS